MIIELVGPPGAGKSTLLPAVVDSLAAASGGPVSTASAAVDRQLGRRTGEKLLLKIVGSHPRRARLLLVDLPHGVAFVIGHPRLAVTVASAILRAPVGPGHRLTLLFRWLGVAARQRYLGSHADVSAVVFDEGFYHRAVNLFAWHGVGRRREGWSERELRRYLELVPAPSMAVFVDAPDAVARHRVDARGLPIRLRGRSDADVAAFLGHAAMIARRLPDLTGTRTEWLRIDNAGTLEAATAELARQVASSPIIAHARGHTPWPSGGRGRLPRLPRPDRWLRTRPRPLSSAEHDRLVAACAGLGLRIGGGSRTVGAGRSWSTIVETDRGTVVVKRYKPSVERAAIDAEHGALRFLAERSIPAPRLVSGDGHGTLATLPDGRYSAFRYEPGLAASHALITTPGDRRRLTTAAGRALGLLHGVMAESEAAAFPAIGLDAGGRRVVPAAAYVGHLKGFSSVAAERLCRLEEELTGAGLTRTIVHGDFGPYNVLVGRGRPLLVVDFELARLDWALVDVATALPRFAEGRLGFAPDRFHAFVAGYLESGSLGRDELGLAPLVLEYLSLRRAARCLERHALSGESRWLDEGRRRLATAERLEDGTHWLVGGVREVLA